MDDIPKRMKELKDENAKLKSIINGKTFPTTDPRVAELEAENAKLHNVVKLHVDHWCDDDEDIKQQALRVLDAEVVEGDTSYVPRMGALAELLADECLKLKAENAKLAGRAARLSGALTNCLKDLDQFGNLAIVTRHLAETALKGGEA